MILFLELTIPGGLGAMAPSIFRNKNRKGKQRKKERALKEKLLKGCH